MSGTSVSVPELSMKGSPGGESVRVTPIKRFICPEPLIQCKRMRVGGRREIHLLLGFSERNRGKKKQLSGRAKEV